MPRRVALAYHAVTDSWPHPLAITPAAFRLQVQRLAARGFRGVTLSQLAAGVDGAAVAITFDDGFASVATAANPILDVVGWPATVYAVTDLVGSGPLRHIGGDGADEARVALDWRQLEALAGDGWEVGSHTCTHRLLTTLPPDELEHELVASHDAVASRIGDCRSVSYPFGAFDDRTIAAARRAGYAAGSGLAGRFLRGEALAIPRVAVGAADGAARFGVKTSHLFALVRSTRAWDVLDATRRVARPHGV